jgi:hypothetical protein
LPRPIAGDSATLLRQEKPGLRETFDRRGT